MTVGEAVDPHCRQHEYDLVLMDVQMPRTSTALTATIHDSRALNGGHRSTPADHRHDRATP
jgi:CheY-like chemotaxis protein